MNKIFSCLIVILFCAAMQIHPAGDTSPGLKINAERTNETIKIDGILTEQIWKKQGFTHFVQQDPDNGQAASFPCEVWLAYDDDAIYLGARYYDDEPELIMARLVRRDFIWGDPSDGCVLYLDSFGDKRSGYFFYVSAAGAVADGLIYNDAKQPNDLSWDAVWDGAANIDSEGWTIEMRIPYSQIRFKEQDPQNWGINVERFISRKVETDMIAHTPRNETGFVSRFPDIIGLTGVKPAAHFELLPYVTAKAEYTGNDPGDPFNSGKEYTPNMGLDFRTGLSNSLTLNATINPDFGQVEVDPAVVNLSDVEYSFEEKRPFFTEGVTIYRFGNGGVSSNSSFNWNAPNIFYSRRIGRNPQGYLPPYDYADLPDGTKILGAAKVSGQVLNDWNLGTLHSVTGREYAEIQNGTVRSDVEMEPLTYYGVLRTQRDFNSGMQGFGILSTYVYRFFKDETLSNFINRNAFVAAADGWTFLDSDKTYVISGWGGISNAAGTEKRMTALQRSSGHYFQRPDVSYISVDTSLTSMTGYAGRVMFNKQKGKFVFNSAAGFLSPKFEINDLGYNPYSDLINMHFMATYRWQEPTSWYQTTGISAATFANYDFGGNNTAQGYWLSSYFTHTSHNGFNLSFSYNPETYNARRTRGGPLTLNPINRNFNVSFFTDFRNDWVLNAGTYGRYGEDQNTISYYAYLELKLTPTLTLALGPEIGKSLSSAQWVTVYNDPEASVTYDKRYVFANLDQNTISAEIRADWIINPKLSFQIYLQPLIASGNYTDYKMLDKPKSYDFVKYGDGGSTIETDNSSGTTIYRLDADGEGPSQQRAIGNPDFNIISLRGNAVLRWEYMAGSTLFLVWTQSREDYTQSGEFNFTSSAADMFTIEPENIFMIKVTYLL